MRTLNEKSTRPRKMRLPAHISERTRPIGWAFRPKLPATSKLSESTESAKTKECSNAK